jgi:taurine dioxygenase
MHCIVAPQAGGETLFASGALCYDLLGSALRARADVAVVRYSDYSDDSAKLEFTCGGTKLADAGAAKVIQRLPLVRVHPTTGRKSIWATPRFVESVEGLSVEDSRELVSQCMRPGTEPAHVYVHKYVEGDVSDLTTACELVGSLPTHYHSLPGCYMGRSPVFTLHLSAC